jgi:hypothetical protein
MDGAGRHHYGKGMDEPEAKEKGFWAVVRRTAIELLVGTGVGFMVWHAIGVSLLEFKYGSIGSSVTCAGDVQRALEEYVQGLRISALVGAILGVVVAIVVRVWWRRRKARKEIVKPKDDAKAAKDAKVTKGAKDDLEAKE